jgi:hypothetical protein
MMTKHLLFVGYSMSDDNVIRLARQIQLFRANHGHPEPRAVGTVLVPSVDPVKARLWEGMLDYVQLPRPATDPARNLMIFLDLVGMHACADLHYFFDSRYEGLLNSEEVRLKDALFGIARFADTTAVGPGVRHALRRLLDELGYADDPGTRTTSQI